MRNLSHWKRKYYSVSDRDKDVMIHTVIFDAGGTLVDGPDLFDVIAEKIREKHDICVREELSRIFKELMNSPTFQDIKSLLDTSTIKVLEAHRIFNSSIQPSLIYRDIYLRQSSLFDGVLEVLEFLRKEDICLILASDADADVLLPELDMLGIKGYFEDIIVSSDIRCYKISPDIGKHLIPRLRKPYDCILFVGDSAADIHAANAIGAQPVIISREGKKIPGGCIITHLLQIKELLEIGTLKKQ